MVMTPPILRQLNTRTIIACLRRLGAATRAELAKAAVMSSVTAGKIVDQLLEDHVLEEFESPTDNTVARLGRPGRMVRLNTSDRCFLAVQLGVSHTRIAVTSAGFVGPDAWDNQIETPDSAAEWLTALSKAAVGLNRSSLAMAIISVPGIVDEQRGRVLLSPNLHWTEKADLRELMREVWDIPTILVQEIRAIALGYQTLNPDIEDYLLVDIGEGMGAATVLDGQLYNGPLPLSGEIGHTPVPGNNRTCGCGGVGCIETLMSRSGLVATFRQVRQSPRATWATFRDNVLENGLDPWLAAQLDSAAAVIAGALNLLGLRRAVITGSVAELGPDVAGHVCQAVARSAMWARFGSIDCRVEPRHRVVGMVAMGLQHQLHGAGPMVEEAGHIILQKKA